jgi:hypothetical protein
VRIYTTLFELIFGLFFFVLLNKSLPTANVNEIGVVNPLEKTPEQDTEDLRQKHFDI